MGRQRLQIRVGPRVRDAGNVDGQGCIDYPHALEQGRDVNQIDRPGQQACSITDDQLPERPQHIRSLYQPAVHVRYWAIHEWPVQNRALKTNRARPAGFMRNVPLVAVLRRAELKRIGGTAKHDGGSIIIGETKRQTLSAPKAGEQRKNCEPNIYNFDDSHLLFSFLG